MSGIGKWGIWGVMSEEKSGGIPWGAVVTALLAGLAGLSSGGKLGADAARADERALIREEEVLKLEVERLRSDVDVLRSGVAGHVGELNRLDLRVGRLEE